MKRFAPPASQQQKQRPKVSTSYFDDDDDDDDDNQMTYPTNTPSKSFSSSGALSSSSTATSTYPEDDDDEPDPLDAFMVGVEKQIKKQDEIREQVQLQQQPPLPEIVSSDGFYDDDERYDEYDNIQSADGDGIDSSTVNDEYEYDSDGQLAPKNPNKTKIEPLPAVDHSTIQYPSFKKSFYTIHPTISSLTDTEVKTIRNNFEISVSGSNIPKPITTFSQINFPMDLAKEIQKREFEKPTAIQAQALPVVLSGRDLIGLAKTGSGKTFSFVWPMIVHVINQPQMRTGDGPIGVILAPTRELASQIYSEMNKFARVYFIRICAVFGGAGKYEMTKALKECPEVVVATPGRFIELLRLKATNLERCTMVVLDEADRMFEMGFQYQMRSIVNNIRPDRQTLLFSATMKKRVEEFAREILTNPVRVIVGVIGQANPDIKQCVEIIESSSNSGGYHNCTSDSSSNSSTSSGYGASSSVNKNNSNIGNNGSNSITNSGKWKWLSANIDDFVANGKVLIFVSNKIETDTLSKHLQNYFNIRQLDIQVGSIHGDKDQTERSAIIRQFSKNSSVGGGSTGLSILVATDVASRGLDIKDIRTVINYEVPKNIETYVHRIGRTGRMGVDGVVPGTAYSLLLSPQDSSFACDLIQNLRLSNQMIPPTLVQLAEKDGKYMSMKYGSGSSTGSGNRGSGNRGSGRGSSAPSMSGTGAERGAGVGFGGPHRAPKAMTSESLAQATAHTRAPTFVAGGSSMSGNSAIVDKYINSRNDAAMTDKSAGNQFTPPLPLYETAMPHSSLLLSQTPTSSQATTSTASSTTGDPIKRKSRFSAAPPAPILSGFVKATNSYSSVVDTTIPSTQPKQVPTPLPQVHVLPVSSTAINLAQVTIPIATKPSMMSILNSDLSSSNSLINNSSNISQVNFSSNIPSTTSTDSTNTPAVPVPVPVKKRSRWDQPSASSE